MDIDEEAENVVKKVLAEFPGVWVGGRQHALLTRVMIDFGRRCVRDAVEQNKLPTVVASEGRAFDTAVDRALHEQDYHRAYVLTEGYAERLKVDLANVMVELSILKEQVTCFRLAIILTTGSNA